MDDDQVPIRQVRTRVVSGQVPPRTQFRLAKQFARVALKYIGAGFSVCWFRLDVAVHRYATTNPGYRWSMNNGPGQQLTVLDLDVLKPRSRPFTDPTVARPLRRRASFPSDSRSPSASRACS